MKREIREVDRQRGILQITTEDQRFYGRQVSVEWGGEKPREKLWDYVPSVTWIAGYYPKNDRFISYVGRVGNEAATEAKEAGGEKGTKVHQAAKALLHGATVNIDTDCFEGREGKPGLLNAVEIECLLSLVDWLNATKPKIIAVEFTVWSEKYRYAGTVDLYCIIDGIHWIVDFKVSPQIYPSMEIQVSAYKFADARFPKTTRLAILQLNYKYNKKQKYKFTRVKQQFTLFLAVRRTWAKECENIQPYQKDFPLSISLSPELCLEENV